MARKKITIKSYFPTGIKELLEHTFTEKNIIAWGKKPHALILPRAYGFVNQFLKMYYYKQRDYSEYTPLADGLKDIFIKDHNHRWIIGKIEEAGIVEVRKLSGGQEYSWKGNKAKEYRFNQNLVRGELVQVSYVKTKQPTQEVESWNTTYIIDERGSKEPIIICDDVIHKGTYEALKKIEYIGTSNIMELVNIYENDFRRKIKKYNATMDKYGSIDYNIKGKKKVLLANRHTYKTVEEFEETRLRTQKLCYASYINSVVERKFIPKRNNSNYRLNHTLTQLPKIFYKYLEMDNEEIYEIDLKNSQFTLLSSILCLFNNFGGKENKERIQEIAKLEKYIGGVKEYITVTYHHILSSVLYDDVLLFIEYCQSGVLYENISVELYGNESHREAIKLELFKLLFGNYIEKPGEVYDKFKEVFPNVIAFIREFKKLMEQRFEEEEIEEDLLEYFNCFSAKKNAFKLGNDFLPIQLQRIESAIFIDIVLKRLYEEGYCVLSKHDSFLVPESQKDAVYDIVYEELTNVLGKDSFVLRTPQLISASKGQIADVLPKAA